MDNQWNQADQNNTDGNTGRPAVPAFTGFTPVMEETSPALRVRQSGLGIASFSLFGAMAAVFVTLLVVFVSKISDLDVSDPDAITSQIEDMPELGVIALFMFGTFIGNLVGLILGIVGLVQKGRKKIFAILGTVFNGLVVGFLALLLLIALVSAFGA